MNAKQLYCYKEYNYIEQFKGLYEMQTKNIIFITFIKFTITVNLHCPKKATVNLSAMHIFP